MKKAIALLLALIFAAALFASCVKKGGSSSGEDTEHGSAHTSPAKEEGFEVAAGAEGSLSIMLLDGDSFRSTDADLGETSADDSNTSWGTSVDLSDPSYGLSKVALLPVALNVVQDGDSVTVPDLTVLYAPSFGHDGRIDSIDTETVAAKYNFFSGVFETYEGYAGVRAIGVPSDGAEGNDARFDEALGFALDFGFRTDRANGSILDLNGVGAYYQGDSYLQFSFAEPEGNTGVEYLKSVMSAVRIVFAEPQFYEGALIGYKVLAIGAAHKTASGVTASAGDGSGSSYSVPLDGERIENGWRAPIALYDYSVTSFDGEASYITLGEKKGTLEIATLDQNVGKKITVIVYLDGDYLDTRMTSNAWPSMICKLNLQFTAENE